MAGPKRRQMAGVVTSVRFDADLYYWARSKGVNVSKAANAALRAMRVQSDTGAPNSDDLISRAAQAQDAATLDLIAEETRKTQTAMHESLDVIRADFAKYVSTGEKPKDAKLAWLNERKKRFTALVGWSDEVLLSNVEEAPPALP